MKLYLKRFVTAYPFVNIAFLFLALFVMRRYGIELGFVRLAIGAFTVSAFISLSVTIFKSHIGNSLVNIILGFLILIPVVFTTRRLFDIFIFRFSVVIYLFSFLVAIVYGICILLTSRRYQKEDRYLNELLSKNEEKDKSDLK